MPSCSRRTDRSREPRRSGRSSKQWLRSLENLGQRLAWSSSLSRATMLTFCGAQRLSITCTRWARTRSLCETERSWRSHLPARSRPRTEKNAEEETVAAYDHYSEPQRKTTVRFFSTLGAAILRPANSPGKLESIALD